MTDACPACSSADLEVVYEKRGIPVNSCLLVDTEQEAREFPLGDMRLAFCRACGFLFNADFEPSKATYSTAYEETQGFSPHFREFARFLAHRWIDSFDIHGKNVLEIGCGKAEFLSLICELGGNHGIGVDPSAIPERLPSSGGQVRLIQDFYSEKYADLPADVLICRHTLEHIGPVAEFMTSLRSAIGDRTDMVVLFELPDVLRVLREVAFWDVYYEHCSYFSLGSMARLFRRTGFEVTDLDVVYDGQYLLIEARPSSVPAAGEPLSQEDDLEDLAKGVETYRNGIRDLINRWRSELSEVAGRGGKPVIWGGGSKGVAYLSTLGIDDSVRCAVDINPYKQDKFLAGTGQRVVAPSFLRGYRPELVVAMNPVYQSEIECDLRAVGVDATVKAV